MKTKRFDFNFKPLQMQCSIVVDGSVPDKQNYDADTNTYTPDYTLTPFILQPTVSRLDKDEMLAAGTVNHELANVKWYEIYNGVRTLITTTNPNYEVTASGTQAGRIKVKRNAAPNAPITLEYYAEYTDARTNQLHTIRATHIVKCDNSTVYAPVLNLDAADQTVYNPLADAETQTVHASLRCGAAECPTANRIFVWEIFRADDNAWSAVGADSVLDYDVEVSADGASVTVNRDLMGDALIMRCRAKYSNTGNPASVVLTDSAPTKVFAFVRRIPKFEFDISGLPVNIPAGIVEVKPEAKVWNTNGPIDNFTKELLALWYLATNKASGTLSYVLVGHGEAPTIRTDLMSNVHGGVFGLEVIDRGPVCAWEDGNGDLFEDADGNIILIH